MQGKIFIFILNVERKKGEKNQRRWSLAGGFRRTGSRAGQVGAATWQGIFSRLECWSRPQQSCKCAYRVEKWGSSYYYFFPFSFFRERKKDKRILRSGRADDVEMFGCLGNDQDKVAAIWTLAHIIYTGPAQKDLFSKRLVSLFMHLVITYECSPPPSLFFFYIIHQPKAQLWMWWEESLKKKIKIKNTARHFATREIYI